MTSTRSSFFHLLALILISVNSLRMWKDNDVAAGVLSLVAYNRYNIVSCDNNNNNTKEKVISRYTCIFTSFALSTGTECYKAESFKVGCLQLKTDISILVSKHVQIRNTTCQNIDEFAKLWCQHRIPYLRLLGKPYTLLYVKRNASRLATCLLYTSPSPRDGLLSRMPSSA